MQTVCGFQPNSSYFDNILRIVIFDEMSHWTKRNIDEMIFDEMLWKEMSRCMDINPPRHLPSHEKWHDCTKVPSDE